MSSRCLVVGLLLEDEGDLLQRLVSVLPDGALYSAVVVDPGAGTRRSDMCNYGESLGRALYRGAVQQQGEERRTETELEVESPYGQEMVLDLHDCLTQKFTPEGVEQYCIELCNVIDMRREGFHVWASDPADLDTDPDHLHGVSAVQFISTSSLVVHAITKMRRVYVNIFSCKRFDPAGATEFTAAYFGGHVVSQRLLGRM